MSIFKKSALIAPPTEIAAYNAVVRDINLIPANVSNFQLTYSTILTLISDADMSGVIFTLTGSFNGFPIQEQIIGPNNDAVTTVYFYDKIISLVASNNIAELLVLSTGDRAIVVFDSYNSTNVKNINYNFNILVKSVGANAPWGQAIDDNGNPRGCFVYGVSAKRPDIIANSYVIPNINAPGVGYPNNPYLTFVNNIADDITQNIIQNGYFASTIYPYYSVIVYISAVVNSLTFVEITQS